MYGWLWQRLPGPSAVRVLLLLALFTGVALALWNWVFPPLYEYLEIDDSSLG